MCDIMQMAIFCETEWSQYYATINVCKVLHIVRNAKVCKLRKK